MIQFAHIFQLGWNHQLVFMKEWDVLDSVFYLVFCWGGSRLCVYRFDKAICSFFGSFFHMASCFSIYWMAGMSISFVSMPSVGPINICWQLFNSDLLMPRCPSHAENPLGWRRSKSQVFVRLVCTLRKFNIDTLQGTNISHLGTRSENHRLFKVPAMVRDMLVRSQECTTNIDDTRNYIYIYSFQGWESPLIFLGPRLSVSQQALGGFPSHRFLPWKNPQLPAEKSLPWAWKATAQTKVDHLQNFHVPRPTLRVKRKVTSVKAEVVVPLLSLISSWKAELTRSIP